MTMTIKRYHWKVYSILPDVGEIVWQYGHCYDREAALEHMIRYVNLYRCEFDFYSVEVPNHD